MNEHAKSIYEYVVKPCIVGLLTFGIFLVVSVFINSLKSNPLSNLNYIMSIGAMCGCIACLGWGFAKATHRKMNGSRETIGFALGAIPITFCYIGYTVQIAAIGDGAAQLFGVISKDASAVLFDIATILSVAGILFLYLKCIQKDTYIKKLKADISGLKTERSQIK